MSTTTYFAFPTPSSTNLIWSNPNVRILILMWNYLKKQKRRRKKENLLPTTKLVKYVNISHALNSKRNSFFPFCHTFAPTSSPLSACPFTSARFRFISCHIKSLKFRQLSIEYFKFLLLLFPFRFCGRCSSVVPTRYTVFSHRYSVDMFCIYVKISEILTTPIRIHRPYR